MNSKIEIVLDEKAALLAKLGKLPPIEIQVPQEVYDQMSGTAAETATDVETSGGAESAPPEEPEGD